MNKIATFTAGMLLSVAAFAQGVPHSLLIYQRDVTGFEVNIYDVAPTPGSNCSLQMDASTYLPSCISVPAAPAQSASTRGLNSAFQVSATRNSMVFYSVQVVVTSTIASGQDGELVFEIASNSGFTTNVQTIMASPCSQAFSLVIAIQSIQKCSLNVSGFVPAGYYARLRTVNTTGTPVFTYRAGQEILM